MAGHAVERDAAAGRTSSTNGSFGALLRSHRIGANLTQEELARRSGMSAQAISLLERGARRAPRPSTVECLAGALNLEAQQREALVAAARGQAAAPAAPAPPPPRRIRRRRWAGRGAALAASLIAGLLVAALLAGWPSPAPPPRLAAPLIGARGSNWASANAEVGPLQTQRVFHRALPPSFAGTPESRLPSGVVPIVSYRIATTDVSSYIRSVSRPVILIFGYNPEGGLSASSFLSQFERQSNLVRSAGNPRVKVAMSSQVYWYRPSVNLPAARCGYIPPAAYVDYYLAAVYDPYLQGISGTDGGGFVAWERCTSGRHRLRGLVEYGLGLGTRGSTACRAESERTSVMYSDMEYLRQTIPDLTILEYWWAMATHPACSRSWQFAPRSTTGDLWRAIASRGLLR